MQLIERRLSKIGAVAQLGERMTGSHEVRGSIPLSSTNKNNNLTEGTRSRFCFCATFVTGGFLRLFWGGKIV